MPTAETRRPSPIHLNVLRKLRQYSDRENTTPDYLRGRFELPLLGSNQDYPDPEGPLDTLTSSNLQPFTRVRVTRCWSQLAFVPEFAVLHSLKCRSLPKSISAFLLQSLD
jgi:hypothetical protein